MNQITDSKQQDNQSQGEKDDTNKPVFKMDVELVMGKEKWGRGIDVQPFGLSLTEVRGVISLTAVKRDSPAHHQGLKKGDVVLAFQSTNNSPTSASELRTYLRDCQDNGLPARIRVNRKGPAKAGRPKKVPTESQSKEERLASEVSRMQTSRAANPEAHREADRIRKGAERRDWTPEQRDAVKAQNQLYYQATKPPEQAKKTVMERLREENAARAEALSKRLAAMRQRTTPEERLVKKLTPTSSPFTSPLSSPSKKRPRTRYANHGASAPDLNYFMNATGTIQTEDVVVEEVKLAPEGLAEQEASTFDFPTSREVLFNTDWLATDGTPPFHQHLLTLGEDIDTEVMLEASELLREGVEARAAASGRPAPEVVNSLQLAMVAEDTGLARLPPLGDREVSIAAVYIGNPTPGNFSGHYVLMAAHVHQDHVHVFDTAPGYTLNNPRSQLYRAHLGKAAATMKRLGSRNGETHRVVLRFHKMGHLQGPWNSCGAFSLLNGLALLQGINPATLWVQDEQLLRQRLHDFVFCQPEQGGAELTALLLALEDAGAQALLEGESHMATRCDHCHNFPNHYDPRGITSLRSNAVRQLWPRTDVLGYVAQLDAEVEPAWREQRPDENLESSGEETSESSAEETAPPPPTKGKKAPKGKGSKGTPKPVKVKPKKPVKLGSAALKPLKRKGVPPDQRSLCPHCGAWLFAAEAGASDKVTTKWCCGRGKFVTPKLTHYQTPFYEEGVTVDPEFRSSARKLNNMYTFAASGVTGRWRNDFSSGPSFVKIEGKVYHRIYDLSFRNSRGARKNQLCVLDGETRHEEAAAQKVSPLLAQQVFDHLYASSSLYRDYQHLNDLDCDDAQMVFKTTSRKDHGPVLGDAPRTIKDHMPRANEVFAVINDEDDAEPRQVAIWKKGEGSSKLIYTTNPIYEALAYPIMRPSAEASWQPGFLSTTGHPTTHMMYQRQQFLTEPRTWELDRLGQELAVDAASRLEEERLSWVRHNQRELRMGSRQEVADRLGEDASGTRPGQRIYLPATFVGSPRYFRDKYHEGMTIILQKGAPDFFITTTCSPSWAEINPGREEEWDVSPDEEEEEQEGFLASLRKPRLKRKSATGKKLRAQKWKGATGSRWSGRPRNSPGIIARVFRLKLKKLMKDLRGGALFGSKSIYHLSVIEFQKRGLPHAHILIKLKRGLKPADIDEFISTEIPGEEDAELRQLVLRNMVHGPCGKLNPKSPCMRKGFCSKGYPKPASDFSYVDERGFPHYKRVVGEKVVIRRAGRDFEVDSRWVVPYNPHLLRKYQNHTNVEFASSARTCRYLYKYMNKGSDKALAAAVEDGQLVDEVADYEKRRVLGSAEAHWKIYSFPLTDRLPAVQSLTVHLPCHEKVVFAADNPASALDKTTLLERYLNRPKDPIFDSCTYQDYYSNFMEELQPAENGTSFPHPDKKHHIKPRVQGEMLTRMHWLGNGKSQEFFLRLILSMFPARSFEELRTVGGKLYDTYEEAARALNLVTGEKEYEEMMKEAGNILPAAAFRSFFASLMLGDPGTPALSMWNLNKEKLSDDFYLMERLGKEVSENRALLHLSRLLQLHGKTLEGMGLPECQDDSTEVGREPGRWERSEEKAFCDAWAPRLSAEQRRVVDILFAELGLHYVWPPFPTDLTGTTSAQPMPRPPRRFGKKGPRYFALLAPGGSGKTIVLRFVTSFLRSQGKLALCTASTGIAALNYPGGTTCHSMCYLPLDAFDPDLTCRLSMRSQRADLLRQASLLIVDEAFMLQRNSFRALERLIDDLQSTTLKAVVYVGDLMQITPVIKWGSKTDILNASIRFDARWEGYTKLWLTTNLRARTDPEYAAMARSVGEGSAATVCLPGSRIPLTPLPLIRTAGSRAELISFVFPTLQDPYSCIKSGLLSGTNAAIDEWNEEIQSQLPGPFETFYSADSCEDESGTASFAVAPEILASLGDVGVPPSALRLKLNSVVMVVRNLNFADRLCNSTKGIVREILPSRRLVMVEIPREDGSPGPRVPIHRITFKFQPGGRGLTVVRKQLPLRSAYAVTHNKSQGCTLERCGVDLMDDVFAHGALYVDVSRVCRRQDIRVFTHPQRVLNGVPHALNIVYKELLAGEPGRLEEVPDRPPSPDEEPDEDPDQPHSHNPADDPQPN